MRTPKAVILRPSDAAWHERGNGVRTIQLVTSRCGATGLFSGITEFDPGAGVPLHRHDCEESVMVIEGNAIVHLDGAEDRLDCTQVAFIPAGIPHFFRNSSTTDRMRIAWTYASIDATRTMEADGKTGRIDREHSLA